MPSEAESGAIQVTGGTKQDGLQETISKLRRRLAKAENEAELNGGMLRAMTNVEMLPVHRDQLMEVLGFAVEQIAAGKSRRGMIAWDFEAKCARHPETPCGAETTFGVQAVVQYDFQERGVFSTRIILNPDNRELDHQSMGGGISHQL